MNQSSTEGTGYTASPAMRETCQHCFPVGACIQFTRATERFPGWGAANRVSGYFNELATLDRQSWCHSQQGKLAQR
jgi:hypothetical protein